MYSKVLQRIIADANITQEEVSRKCKELNAPISRGRLNNILNGKAPAPDEKVSRAIAQVCDVDDRELVLEGYLAKAPHEFNDLIAIFQEMCFELSVPHLENKYSKEVIEETKELYTEQTIVQIILQILDMPKTCIKFSEDDIQLSDTINNFGMELDFNYYPMNDNSMEDKIPKDSKLRLTIPDKYKNGDIILVEYNNKRYVRLVIFIGSDVFLYPFNREYKSMRLQKNEYKIIAKVDSLKIKL